MSGVTDRVAACPVCGSAGEFAFKARDLQFDGDAYYDYARCMECQAEYQTPTPSAEQIQAFYPQEYDCYEPLPRLKPRSVTERITLNACYCYELEPQGWWVALLGRLIGLFRYSDSIPFRSGGKALDVGCGSGKFVRSMGQLGWDAIGVDFSAQAVKVGRDAGLDIRQGTIAEAGFASESFDLVTARHVIEHIPQPVPWLQELRRVLKPGGLLSLRTPNTAALARPWFGRNWFPDEIPRHLVLFNPRNLHLLLTSQGFERIRIRTYTTPKFFLNSWDYRAGNRGKPSRKKNLHRTLAKIYVLIARLIPGRGDEIFVIYRRK